VSFQFGLTSQQKLATCESGLERLGRWAITRSPVDFTIVCGWRGQADQSLLVQSGASKTPWPLSKHNVVNDIGPCSMAFDFAPYVQGKIPWNDTHLFAVVAGVLFTGFNVLRAADPAFGSGYVLRWGGDWDRDGLTTDQTFMDWGHLELATPVG